MSKEGHEDQDQVQASADELAAFQASFSGAEVPVIAEKEAPKQEEQPKEEPKEEVKEEEAAPPAPSPVPALTSEEIADLRAAASRVSELDSNLRKANGRIGALNDLLQQQQAKKEAEGKPAALTSVEMKRLRDEYPELADAISTDISEMLANLKQAETQQDPDAITSIVKAEVAKERELLRQEALAHRHPDWQDLRDTPTPEYQAWMASLPNDERTKYMESESPYYVADQLDKFKAWRDKAAQAKLKSKERIEDAVAPTGGRASRSSTISEEEAMRQAFAKALSEP